MPGMGLTATKRRPAVFGSRSISAGAFAVGFAQRIAGRTVEDENLRARGGARLDGAAVEPDVIGVRDLLPELGDAAVDGQPAARESILRRARREPRPRWARYFWSRSAAPAGVGRGRAMNCCLASGFVGRRRRHESGGGIAGRGEFFVVGVVVGRGIEAVIAAVFGSARAPAPPPLHRNPGAGVGLGRASFTGLTGAHSPAAAAAG